MDPREGEKETDEAPHLQGGAPAANSPGIGEAAGSGQGFPPRPLTHPSWPPPGYRVCNRHNPTGPLSFSSGKPLNHQPTGKPAPTEASSGKLTWERGDCRKWARLPATASSASQLASAVATAPAFPAAGRSQPRPPLQICSTSDLHHATLRKLQVLLPLSLLQPSVRSVSEAGTRARHLRKGWKGGAKRNQRGAAVGDPERRRRGEEEEEKMRGGESVFPAAAPPAASSKRPAAARELQGFRVRSSGQKNSREREERREWVLGFRV